MSVYKIPSKYYHRIHQVRPRFKNNVEEVLLYISSELSQMKPENKQEFIKKFDRVLKTFPGNMTKTPKTIANWRTEISSLFGFLVELDNGILTPSDNAIMLSERQDLVEFFKYFLYTFQYPGGHMKSHETAKILKHNIKFKPAFYILDLLMVGEKITKNRFGLNKAEVTHCIFNDLRVTSGKIHSSKVVELIQNNRIKNLDYDWQGDVIRYAGDILDYMVYANLLEKHGEFYYLNKAEIDSIQYFLKNKTWFHAYDSFYNTSASRADIEKISGLWFLYVNSFAGKIRFETDLLDYIGIDKSLYKKLASDSLKKISATATEIIPELLQKANTTNPPKAKAIGDAGEALVHGHECMKLKESNRTDLIKKVVHLPNHLAMGYDIRSYDYKGNIKDIEVKSTISHSSLDFNKFHFTDNEWNVACQELAKYFVYRLLISRKDDGRANVKLFVIQNPIEQLKKGFLKAKSGDGMDIIFQPKCGSYEELLIWKN